MLRKRTYSCILWTALAIWLVQAPAFGRGWLERSARGRGTESHVLTVRQAIDFCAFHPSRMYVRTLHGLFLMQYTSALVQRDGALFDSREIPSSAAVDPSHYGGLPASIGKRAYETRGLPASARWLEAKGRLTCQDPPTTSYPHITVWSWQRAAPEGEAPIRAVPGVLSVGETLNMCTSSPGPFRVYVRGRYLVTPSPYIRGRLFGGPSAQGKHRVLSVVTSVRFRGPSIMPAGTAVVVFGLLDCRGQAPQLEAYAWQR